MKKELLEKICQEIKENPKITEPALAKKYNCSERTIRRYIYALKKEGKVQLMGIGSKREWKLL